MSSTPIRTKFYRPSLPSDLVDRTRLIDQLNRGLDRPLTVVSAPAGYGKSILVSAWLNTCERPSAWLSLDETMDDLGVFLTYLVAAIRAVLPGALQETQTLLTAISLPPIGVLTTSLINELDEVERDFIMVLEDYHSIHSREIHDLLTALLQPPCASTCTWCSSRAETRRFRPAYSWRATRWPSSASPICAFRQTRPQLSCRKRLECACPRKRWTALAQKTEGWITSLRLAALMLRNQPDADSRLAELQALEHNRNLTDYLMSEVLAHAPPEVADLSAGDLHPRPDVRPVVRHPARP